MSAFWAGIWLEFVYIPVKCYHSSKREIIYAKQVLRFWIGIYINNKLNVLFIIIKFPLMKLELNSLQSANKLL